LAGGLCPRADKKTAFAPGLTIKATGSAVQSVDRFGPLPAAHNIAGLFSGDL